MPYELVERKLLKWLRAIQFVFCVAQTKRKQKKSLNIILESEISNDYDIDICRWRSICGTLIDLHRKNEDKRSC